MNNETAIDLDEAFAALDEDTQDEYLAAREAFLAAYRKATQATDDAKAAARERDAAAAVLIEHMTERGEKTIKLDTGERITRVETTRYGHRKEDRQLVVEWISKEMLTVNAQTLHGYLRDLAERGEALPEWATQYTTASLSVYGAKPRR